jgi:hypothetical protein
MSEAWGFFLLGLLASFVVSMIVWWLTVHFWRPRISFSEEIAEYELPSQESFFQCAFRNDGKRDVVDLEIYVRVGIEGFLGATGWAYHNWKSNSSRIPLLSEQKIRRVRLFDTREKIEFIDQPSKTLRDRVESCRSLRDVLKLGEDAVVVVHIFGYDRRSNVRAHFQSPQYRLKDIRKGTFRGLDVVGNPRFKD